MSYICELLGLLFLHVPCAISAVMIDCSFRNLIVMGLIVRQTFVEKTDLIVFSIHQTVCSSRTLLCSSGTGNVLKVQHLLHVCSEHYDVKDQV